MRTLVAALSRLLAVFRRRALDHDFREELAAHIDMLAARNESRGLAPDEARRQAILQLGGPHGLKYEHRHARGVTRLENLIDDLANFVRDAVHAARALAKAPAFTVVCVGSLGIGMATVIAIPYYSRIVTDAPPGVEAAGLVELLMAPQGTLRARLGGTMHEAWSYPEAVDIRGASTGVTWTAWAKGDVRAVRDSRRGFETMPALFVSANYFSTIGVPLALGTGFDSTIDTAAAPPVVILTHGYWSGSLGADPRIVGRTITLDEVPHVVVGVAPQDFVYHMGDPRGVRMFLPLERHPRLRANPGLRLDRDLDWVRIHGRLRPGTSLERARAEVAAVVSGLARQYPATTANKAAALEPYMAMGAQGKDALAIVRTIGLGMTSMVLLVVCLNVSGMVQVRTVFRERELAIRHAIGATRAQLVRYQLLEALLLAAVGGAVAVVVLYALPRVLAWGFIDQPLPPAVFDATGVTLPIGAVALGLAVAVTLTFGLWPALRFSRPVAVSALKDDAGGGRRRVGRVQRVTAALQIGLATPFLVVSGLMVDRVRTTATADFGFDLDNLAAIPLGPDELAGQRDREFFLRTMRANLEQADGVQAVTIADGHPLDATGQPVRVAGSDAQFVSADLTRVGDGFFTTLGIPIRRGRAFTPDDREGSERVAVLSPQLASLLFGNRDAVGRQVRVAFDGAVPHTLTVVGVTGSFVPSDLGGDTEQLLVPLAQYPAERVVMIARSMPNAAASWWRASFQRAARPLAPAFTSTRLVTGADLRRRTMDDYLTTSALTGVGGGVALLLGALGVYGVIGFTVATRTREIAVRMALGASRRGVVVLVLGDVVRLVLPGLVIGILPILVARVIVRLPTNVAEPLVYLTAGVVVMAVAMLAGLPAAHRAASVAPMGAMRGE